MTEQEIQQHILLALGSRRDVRCWRVNAGTFRSQTSERRIKGAVAGHPDIAGILAGGRALYVEVKAKRGRQTPEQVAFQAMAQRFGAAYIVARSVEEAVAGVEAALGGAR